MLREFKHLKQERGAGRRRWFESDGFDLVVWLEENGAVAGFQVCYDFGRGEHALTWRRDSGFAHNRVDAGEDAALKNETPILVPDGAVPWDQLRREFARRSENLEAPLRTLVGERLQAQG